MNKEELQLVFSLIDAGQVQRAIDLLLHMHEQMSRSPEQYTMETKAIFYRTFGQILFENSQYSRALGMFRFAQMIEFSEELDQLIVQSFIEPNLEEFENNYNSSMAHLKIYGPIIPFMDLPYALIPTEIQNKYYLYYKKTRMIEEDFGLFELKEQVERSWEQVDLCASLLLIDHYLIGNILADIQNTAKQGQESFIVFEEYGKFLSTLQGGVIESLPNVTIFSSYEKLKNFFENNSQYLPRNVISYSDDGQKAKSYLNHLHQRRLHISNANRDQVILSICIPSYNRGYRALENVIHSLNNVYDYEIEIVVSNNGTKNETAAFYKEIEQYPDSRVTYFEFDENQGFYANIVNVCRLASGRFMLLLSDEDLIDLQVLEKIMSFLALSPNVSLLKTSTTVQGRFDTKTKPGGEEALEEFMLSSNYMSGMILNREIMEQNRVLDHIDDLYRNGNLTAAIYPHMCWELAMCQYGEVHSTLLTFVREGAAEKMETEYIVRMNEQLSVPEYATVESRLEQHKGFYEVMLNLEICSDQRVFRNMYLALCQKTLWLMRVSVHNYYSSILKEAEIAKIFQDTYDYCTSADFLNKLGMDKEVAEQIKELSAAYSTN